jgi:hypothetical protein
MAINAKESNFVETELVPEGNHVARCIKVIEIGTVTNDYKGEVKKQHRIVLTWELPTETRVFKEEKGEQPFVISNEYTLSLSDKATLRAHLQSWRGKAFTADELKGFDVSKLLGVPCMLNVLHKPGVADPTKKYARVQSIATLPKGFTCPNQVNPSFLFDFDSFSTEKFDSLPKFMQEKIAASDEYKAVTNPPLDVEVEETDDLSF